MFPVNRTERIRSSRLNRFRRASTLVLAVCGAAVLGNGAAVAAAPDHVLSAQVSYADLNLASTEGAATLYKRLQGAGRDVCRPLESRMLGVQSIWRECFSRAVSDAVAKIDQPALTAYYRAKTDHGPMPAITTAKN
jgi:UrcA family protein